MLKKLTKSIKTKKIIEKKTKLFCVKDKSFTFSSDLNREIPGIFDEDFDVVICEDIDDILNTNIKEDFIVFFTNLRTPDVFRVKEFSLLRKVNVFLTGILSYISSDPNSYWALYEQTYWTKEMERGIIKVSDLIYVPSGFHKQLINDRISAKIDSKKVKVVNLPITLCNKKVSEIDKEDLVIFIDDDNGNYIYNHIKKYLCNDHTLRILLINKKKESAKYYDLLLRAKVVVIQRVNSIFDERIFEASHCDNVVMAPSTDFYDEFIQEKYTFAFEERPEDIGNRIQIFTMSHKVEKNNVINNIKYGTILNILLECLGEYNQKLEV